MGAVAALALAIAAGAAHAAGEQVAQAPAAGGLLRRAIAKGGGRHGEHTLGLSGDDRNGGGHAGPQQQLVVVDLKPRIVGDDAVGGDRGVGDVADLGVERPLREGIDGEAGMLAGS